MRAGRAEEAGVGRPGQGDGEAAGLPDGEGLESRRRRSASALAASAPPAASKASGEGLGDGRAEPSVTVAAGIAAARCRRPARAAGDGRGRAAFVSGGRHNGRVSTTSPAPGLPSPDRSPRLRDALLAAAFTADGLLDLLGAPAYAALARSETVPALRATRGDSAAGDARTAVPAPAARRRTRAGAGALPARRVPGRRLAGRGTATRYAPRSTCGRTAGPRARTGSSSPTWAARSAAPAASSGQDEGVVLGVGGASTTLAGITVRTPVASALDLGTGSGIQALHAAQHATRVTATDLNPRALHFTALTLALSGAPEADLREGSLFEPVRTTRRTT